jgi:hypothetical protein
VRNVRNVVGMDNNRFAATDGGTGGDGSGPSRPTKGKWLTIGEQIALANAELAALERPDPAMVVDVVAEGLRVLRTRDGVPLTEDMILERARNIAAGLTGVRLDGVRFAARRAPTAEDEANAKEVIR